MYNVIVAVVDPEFTNLKDLSVIAADGEYNEFNDVLLLPLIIMAM